MSRLLLLGFVQRVHRLPVQGCISGREPILRTPSSVQRWQCTDCCGEGASDWLFRDKSVLSGDGGTTACCNARCERQLGQMPHRVGRSAVHLYEHQGRIEMQHLGLTSVVISAAVLLLSLTHQTFYLGYS